MAVGVWQNERLDLARAGLQRGGDLERGNDLESCFAVLQPSPVDRRVASAGEGADAGAESLLILDRPTFTATLPELLEVPPQFVQSRLSNRRRELVPGVLEEPLTVLCEVRWEGDSDSPRRESRQQSACRWRKPRKSPPVPSVIRQTNTPRPSGWMPTGSLSGKYRTCSTSPCRTFR